MTILTPDDEIQEDGFFYPPFKTGFIYHGATYRGHSDLSVDFNRRDEKGNWLQDEGDPVLAAANGKVTEVNKADGLVMLVHYKGLWQTEYRHMKDIIVKVGDRVKRGDRIGRIGNVAGTGSSFGPHLHHVHWRRDNRKEPFFRTKMRLLDKPIATSVVNSSKKPEAWEAPDPVIVVGPLKPVTWKSAYRQMRKQCESLNNSMTGMQILLDTTNIENEDLKEQVEELKAKLTLGNPADLAYLRDQIARIKSITEE